jgi:hypothetical protein
MAALRTLPISLAISLLAIASFLFAVLVATSHLGR